MGRSGACGAFPARPRNPRDAVGRTIGAALGAGADMRIGVLGEREGCGDTAVMGTEGLERLELERERCAPGDTIGGRVPAGAVLRAVDLVRVERSPTSTLEFTAASVAPLADGAFALTVPADAPPTVQGQRCSLVWRVRARAGEYPEHSDARRTLEIACRS
jgi:hypothetical protein